MAISGRVVVVNAGRNEQQGSPRDPDAAPASRGVADVIGWAGIIAGDRDGTAVAPDPAQVTHAQAGVSPNLNSNFGRKANMA